MPGPDLIRALRRASAVSLMGGRDGFRSGPGLGSGAGLACELAGIEPEFDCIEDGDAEKLSASLNRKRRSMTSAQAAVVAAKAWQLAIDQKRVAQHGEIGRGRVDKVSTLIPRPRKHFADLYGVSEIYVRDAKFILDMVPEKAEEVLAGSLERAGGLIRIKYPN